MHWISGFYKQSRLNYVHTDEDCDIHLGLSIWTCFFEPVYVDPSFGPVYLDPYIWTPLFGPVYLDPPIATCIFNILFGSFYLDKSILTCLFGTLLFNKSILAHLFGLVCFDPSILTCLFGPVYADLSICSSQSLGDRRSPQYISADHNESSTKNQQQLKKMHKQPTKKSSKINFRQ